MATSQAQSVDELIMCVVGMGFEVEDAQAAIKIGKLTAQEAVEWILAGKPMPKGMISGPTLKLGNAREPAEGQPVGSNPFVNPPPVLAPQQGEEAMDQEESKIVSRMTMREDQRVIKNNFEQKQRNEARKNAKDEKVAQKKAHAQILQQIQEDRETQKMRKQGGQVPDPKQPRDNTPEGSENADQAAAASSSSSDSNVQKTPSKCLIQVRLPDGRVLRENFTPTSQLSEVWSYILRQYSAAANMTLIQPFPRTEFDDSHMLQSLGDLGLVPTCSLALKKSEKPRNEAVMDTERIPGDGSETGRPLGDGASDLSLGPVPPQPLVPPLMPNPGYGQPLHTWGSGHRLTEDTPEGQEEEPSIDVPNNANVEMDTDNEEDVDVEFGVPPPPGGGPGIVGGGGAIGGAPGGVWGGVPGGMQVWGGQPAEEQAFWGVGQRLADVPDPDNMPHHSQNPQDLAREAAQRRYQDNPVQPLGPEIVMNAPANLHQVPPLMLLAIRNVTTRICDTRNPITGLHGLPADIAIKVLEYLIAERLLRPKTLQPFVTCRLRKLVLDCYPYVTNELLTALRLHNNLTHLSLSSCTLFTDRGLQPLTVLKRMKVLNLSSCDQLTNNCMPILAEFKSLVSLVLENTKVSDAGIRVYADSQPQCLQTLNLSRTSVTHQIFHILKDIPNLRALILEQTQVAGLSGVQNLTNLETLNIASTPIQTDSLLCLSQHRSLTALNVANTQNVDGDLALQYIAGLKLQLLQLPNRLTTTSEGMKHITDMPLVVLDLTNYTHVDDVGMEHVGKIKSLKKLRLGNTKISDQGMIFLGGLNNLEELLLERTAITDAGASVIMTFSRLQELSLSETGITNRFLRDKVLNNCSSLSKLNLSRTSISDKGIKHLRLPSLSLLNLDGTRVRMETVAAVVSCPVTLGSLRTPPGSEEEI